MHQGGHPPQQAPRGILMLVTSVTKIEGDLAWVGCVEVRSHFSFGAAHLQDADFADLRIGQVVFIEREIVHGTPCQQAAPMRVWTVRPVEKLVASESTSDHT